MPLKVDSAQVNCYARVCWGQPEEQVMKKGGSLTKSTAIKVKVRITLKLINSTYLQSACKVSFT